MVTTWSAIRRAKHVEDAAAQAGAEGLARALQAQDAISAGAQTVRISNPTGYGQGMSRVFVERLEHYAAELGSRTAIREVEVEPA